MSADAGSMPRTAEHAPAVSRGAAGLLLAVTILAVAVNAWAHSYAERTPIGVVVSWCLFVLAVPTWLAMSISALRRGQRPPFLVAVPVLIALLLVATRLDLPQTVRFGLSRAAFDRLVVLAGPPPAPPAPADADTPGAFPIACPSGVGLYGITACQTDDGGYYFYENADEASGFAYLPSGPPGAAPDGTQPSWQYTDRGDGWYAFALADESD
ncbi:hypothetical protein GCM10022236_35260 [Microlunatus ginsengisoli]|uniref:DUF1109 domain-containing protein n=2 Tax=Microlunatus ginsengisoli TaxID=363863 RepID=A0ABP7AD95_9ACTN